MASKPTTDFEREFATVRDAVQIIGVSKTTLQKMRADKSLNGPPWFPCCNKVLYPIADLRAWAANRVATTMGVHP